MWNCKGAFTNYVAPISGISDPPSPLCSTFIANCPIPPRTKIKQRKHLKTTVSASFFFLHLFLSFFLPPLFFLCLGARSTPYPPRVLRNLWMLPNVIEILPSEPYKINVFPPRSYVTYPRSVKWQSSGTFLFQTWTLPSIHEVLKEIGTSIRKRQQIGTSNWKSDLWAWDKMLETVQQSAIRTISLKKAPPYSNFFLK